MSEIKLGDNYTVKENSSGNLEIVDNDGTAVLTHDDGADTLTIADAFGGDVDFGSNDAKNIAALEAGNVDITDETLVSVTLGSNKSLSAGSAETLTLDTVRKDELGEFDTSTNEFTPSETGFYIVSFSTQFLVGSDGDTLKTTFRSAGDGDRIKSQVNTGGTLSHILNANKILKLTAGNNYILEVENVNSSDEINSGDPNTYLSIRRAFR